MRRGARERILRPKRADLLHLRAYVSPRLCAESVFDMVDGIGKHFHHVEAHVHVVAAEFHQKIARDVDIPPLLMRLHRLGRRAEFFGQAGFDLAKDDCIPVRRHDVRLAEGGAVIRLYDFVSEGAEVFCGAPLSAPSQNFFVNVLR